MAAGRTRLMPLSVYAALTPEQYEVLADRTLRVAEATRSASAIASPVLPSRNFDNIAEILVAASPESGVERLILASRFSMWMYWLDYCIDEIPRNSPAMVAAIHERVEDVLRGGRGSDALSASFAELLEEYARTPAAAIFLPQIRNQVFRELAADRALLALAAQAQETHQLPAPVEWLFHATHGVNHMSCTLSLLAVLDAPIAPAQLDALWWPLWRAAECVRLANDWRTHTKDEQEGLLHSLCFWPEHEVRARVARGLAELARCIEQYVAEGGAAAHAGVLQRLTRIGVEVYGFKDIRYDS